MHFIIFIILLIRYLIEIREIITSSAEYYILNIYTM